MQNHPKYSQKRNQILSHDLCVQTSLGTLTCVSPLVYCTLLWSLRQAPWPLRGHLTVSSLQNILPGTTPLDSWRLKSTPCLKVPTPCTLVMIPYSGAFLCYVFVHAAPPRVILAICLLVGWLLPSVPASWRQGLFLPLLLGSKKKSSSVHVYFQFIAFFMMSLLFLKHLKTVALKPHLNQLKYLLNAYSKHTLA